MNAAQAGGGVGQMRSVLVTMTSQYKVIMTSFCVQRGEGVKNGPKIAVILKVCPLKDSYLVKVQFRLTGLVNMSYGGISKPMNKRRENFLQKYSKQFHSLVTSQGSLKVTTLLLPALARECTQNSLEEKYVHSTSMEKPAFRCCEPITLQQLPSKYSRA